MASESLVKYALSYSGDDIDKLLGDVNSNKFALSDIVVVGDTQPDSETCLIWVETDSNGIKNVWVRV